MYDVAALSARLLDGGLPPADLPPADPESGVLPLGVDRLGDVGATLFGRRDADGVAWLDLYGLERADGGWRVLAGASVAAGDVPPWQSPPLRLEGSADVDVLVSGTAARRPWSPWPRRRVLGYLGLQAPAGVRRLSLGDRELTVPEHGLLAIVTDRRRLHLVPGGREGALLRARLT